MKFTRMIALAFALALVAPNAVGAAQAAGHDGVASIAKKDGKAKKGAKTKAKAKKGKKGKKPAPTQDGDDEGAELEPDDSEQ